MDLVQHHFTTVLGAPRWRDLDFDWDFLNIPSVNLAHLVAPFTQQEILAALKQMPKDKAPGPNGYMMAFLSSCWDIIKQDLMVVLHAFHV